MSAKMKNALKSIAVFVALATASGLLLGFINKLTYVDKFDTVLEDFEKYYDVSGGYRIVGENIGDVKYFAVSKNPDKIYAVLSKGKGGYGGDVYMYIFIKDNKIVKLVYGENSETWLRKLDAVNYLDGFLNKDLDSPNGFAPDAVSNVTLASNAIKNAVDNAVEVYKNYINQGALV